MKSKKQIIILTVALVFIIFLGILTLYLANKNDTDKSSEDRKTPDAGTKFSEGYYKEKKLYSENDYFSPFFKFVNYDNKTAKYAKIEGYGELDFVDAFTLESVENFSADIGLPYWCTYNNQIFTLEITKNKEILIKEINSKTSQVENEAILENFTGYIGENDDNDFFINATNFVVDDKYIYILTDRKLLEIFTREGEPYAVYENINNFDIDGNGNLYIVYTRVHEPSGFDKIDMQSKEIIYTRFFLGKKYQAIDFIKCRGGYVYIVEMKNIVAFEASSGEEIDNIFTFGVDSSFFVSQENRICDFFVGENRRLFVAYDDSGGEIPVTEYYTYEFVVGEREEKEETLTISAPYRLPFIDEVIKRYENKYPDEHIKYDYKYDTEDEYLKNIDIYQKQFTTETISGDIGDIVLAGGSRIKYRELFETDVFVDLTDFIMNDKSYNDLNKAVINAIKIDGKISGLPIGCAYEIMEINKTLFEKLNINKPIDNLKWSDVLSLIDIIEKEAPESYLFVSYHSPVEMFLQRMLMSNMPDLISTKDKEVNLKQTWFMKLIEDLKTASKSKNFVQINPKWDYGNFLYESLIGFRQINTRLYSDLMNDYCRNQEGDRKILLVPFISGEQSSNRIAYSPSMFSVNARSKNKERAYKFLSLLLEEDIQTLRDLPGMPINKKAENRLLKDAERTYKVDFGEEEVHNFSEMIKDVTVHIDYLYDMDYYIQDILAPLMEYMNDKISLKEAIKKAEDNVWVRLNE